jgi:hypothetical protein
MIKMPYSALQFTVLALLASVHCGDEPATTTSDDSGEPPFHTQGQLFRSDWSSVRGNSDDAHSDGGRWTELFCSPAVRRRVLAVVPGPSAGWTATPNVMQVTNRGDQNCGLVESVVAPRGASYFIRMYIRVEDEKQNSFHSVNVNSMGDIQVPLWAIFDPVAGVDYSPKLTLAHPNPSEIRNWRPRMKIPMAQWYRFEWHVEIFDVANRSARIWPRIYDMPGNLVADASAYIQEANPSSPLTLQQWYDNGGFQRFTDIEMARKFGLGYEGPTGAVDNGRKWYYASVEIRSDTWVGPIR